jgi:hypothetical protein
MIYYGLEMLLPTGKILEQLKIHYKKVLKQILSLYINVADPAIYILSGLLPICDFGSGFSRYVYGSVISYFMQIFLISINQLLLSYNLTCSCLSASLHSEMQTKPYNILYYAVRHYRILGSH